VHPFESGRRPKYRALVLFGGWEGHQPELFADFAGRRLLDGFEVIRSQDLEMLRGDTLRHFDLLLPIWTFGALAENQDVELLKAVEDGLGVVAWHGAASSFLHSRPHKFLLGGQFVAHPGGEGITHTIRFLGNDPLVNGLSDLTVTSEQYYMLIDPAVKVLATTRIDGGPMSWVAGVEMPAAWKRQWGAGRVFYCSPGHTVEVLEQPTMLSLLRRAVLWSAQSRSSTALSTATAP
jgi:type 1 glutamine amidotransferase